jgi:hypothetical protein
MVLTLLQASAAVASAASSGLTFQVGEKSDIIETKTITNGGINLILQDY